MVGNDYKYPEILRLARIQVIIIPIFILFKLLRRQVLAGKSPDFFKAIFLSLPNFFEAITGVLVLSGIGLFINRHLNKTLQLKHKVLYFIATILSGIFVITQEFNILNLRGDNIYDPVDILFSFFGLIIGYLLVIYAHSKSESGVE